MKRIGLIAMTLILALGAMGTGFALWSDTIHLDGTINTGNIGAEWSLKACGDSEIVGKDVSHVEAFIDQSTGNLMVTIVDAYPCIDYWVDFDIHCTGTVPIHMNAVLNRESLPAGATVTFANMDGTPIFWPDVQLHYGEELLGKLLVHLDNDATELTSYTFSVTVDYWQYNEDGPY